LEATTVNILLIEDNPVDARLIREYLAGAEGFAVEWVDHLAKGLEKLGEGKIDVVVSDLNLPDSQGFDTFTRLRESAGHIALLVLSGTDDEEMAIRAVREGAQDYLIKGQVSKGALIRSVRYAVERQAKLVQELAAEKRAKIFGFMGARGGVGSTSLTLNLASWWARNGRSVALGELRSSGGTLAYQLGGTPGTNLSSLLDLEPACITPQELRSRLSKVQPALQILFAPQAASEYREIGSEHTRAIIKALAQSGDTVLLDLPSGHSECTRAAVQCCDFLVIVVEADPVCAAATAALADFLRSCGLSAKVIGAVVVNRVTLGGGMGVREFKAQLPCGVIGVLPPAAEAFMNAQKTGLPVVISRPESTYATAVTELAARLLLDPVPPLDL
jgi:MinD-like ATPase involved in chromosome partitioning or flagellar assembly/CheY-like chemotaxis protein